MGEIDAIEAALTVEAGVFGDCGALFEAWTEAVRDDVEALEGCALDVEPPRPKPRALKAPIEPEDTRLLARLRDRRASMVKSSYDARSFRRTG